MSSVCQVASRSAAKDALVIPGETRQSLLVTINLGIAFFMTKHGFTRPAPMARCQAISTAC